MVNQANILDKADLKSGGWNMVPVKNVTNDFISDLLEKTLKDLAQRQTRHDESAPTSMAMSLRKGVALIDTEEMINTMYQKVSSLKEEAELKEQ